MRIARLLLAGAPLLSSIHALPLIPGDQGSVRAAVRSAAENLMGFYNFAQVGVLPKPYWWWETAGMLGGMVEYWHYTGDATYNDQVARGILSQKGPNNDFMMKDAEGNDDQGWWALAAMSAAEYGFPNLPGEPTYLSLAQNVFNEFKSRWDMTRCNGGMKWKIEPNAPGYHYKSTIANGLAFQLAARLARFTGDPTYQTWASNAYDWTVGVRLIDGTFNVFDGTDDAKSTGCVDVNHDLWSYNSGAFMYGCAVMFDITQDPKWSDRTGGLLGSSVRNFFDNKVMFEARCEKDGTCDVDQLSFKAYLARWMANSAVMIPSFQGAILPFLGMSAQAAARACTGGGNGQMCGHKWLNNGFDGTTGVGQQLDALDVMLGYLVPGASRPLAPGGRP